MPSGSGKITNSQKSSFPGVAPDSFRRTSFASRVRKHDHLQCRQHLVYRLFRRYFYCSILFCSLQQKCLYGEKGCCTGFCATAFLCGMILNALRDIFPRSGWKSFLKGRAKSTAESLLMMPNTLAMGFKPWLPLRGSWCCPSSGATRHLPPVGEGLSGGGTVPG